MRELPKIGLGIGGLMLRCPALTILLSVLTAASSLGEDAGENMMWIVVDEAESGMQVSSSEANDCEWDSDGTGVIGRADEAERSLCTKQRSSRLDVRFCSVSEVTLLLDLGRVGGDVVELDDEEIRQSTTDLRMSKCWD